MAEMPAMTRRHFLVMGASGLTIGVALQGIPGFRGIASAVDAAAATPATLAPASFGAYITIAPDNSVTVVFGGCELGQGSKTGLAQIVAEELHASWSQVSVQQSDANPDVSYLTFGSTAMRT